MTTTQLLRLFHQVQSPSMYGEIARNVTEADLPQLVAELTAQVGDDQKAVFTIVGPELFNYLKHLYESNHPQDKEPAIQV